MLRSRAAFLLLLSALLLPTGGPSLAQTAEDRHEGYYYPKVGSSEVYEARANTLPESTRERRLVFVGLVTQQQAERPYPPIYALYAKGTDAEKLILVSLGENGFRTLYQARGVLAALTALARATPLFQDTEVEDLFTFLDLLKLLGFDQVTVTDGRDWAHRIEIR